MIFFDPLSIDRTAGPSAWDPRAVRWRLVFIFFVCFVFVGVSFSMRGYSFRVIRRWLYFFRTPRVVIFYFWYIFCVFFFDRITIDRPAGAAGLGHASTPLNIWIFFVCFVFACVSFSERVYSFGGYRTLVVFTKYTEDGSFFFLDYFFVDFFDPLSVDRSAGAVGLGCLELTAPHLHVYFCILIFVCHSVGNLNTKCFIYPALFVSTVRPGPSASSALGICTFLFVFFVYYFFFSNDIFFL